jgi:hypothetical protein
MTKAIRTVFKIDTLSLHECEDGYYLYDYVIGMNLSMRAKTEQEAFIEGLTYYQKKLKKVKFEYTKLSNIVESFVSEFVDSEDN